jgi:hypothetical protein
MNIGFLNLAQEFFFDHLNLMHDWYIVIDCLQFDFLLLLLLHMITFII